MEGGQKNNLDLESGLDIKTSDMLVPIQKATFQHNWQRWQGRHLPNSLRFEKNGWAAGWNVYDFKFNTFREMLADGVYAELGQLNAYTNILSIYDSDTSLNALAEYPLITQTQIISGPGTVTGDQTISNSVNGKPYTITNDPVTHIASVTGTDVVLEQTRNTDYSETLKVTDTASEFNFDFDLFLSGDLTGDAIPKTSYSSFNGSTHSWGGYTFDIGTNIVHTPEGINIPVTPVDNKLTFDYTLSVIDERFTVTYSSETFYLSFNSIVCDDLATKGKMIIGEGPSETLAFNKYKGSVSKTILGSGATGYVDITMKVPVYASCIMKPTNNVSVKAKRCNNRSHREIALFYGTGIRNSISHTNAFKGATGTETLPDRYRPVPYTSEYKNQYPQYVTSLPWRFNQIIANNTIEPSKGWSPYKYNIINTDSVWIGASKGYQNLALKDKALFKMLLGDVYTYGTITLNPTTLIEHNNPYKWDVADNICYTESDISEIVSIKRKGKPDNEDTGDDLENIETWFPVEDLMHNIAELTGTVVGYKPAQLALPYAGLYNAGEYIGGTYIHTDIDTDDLTFWPFESVPCFNIDVDGSVFEGVYWTDGTNHITDLEEFKAKVLGAYTDLENRDTSFVTTNTKYSRTRTVKQYAAVYDFDFLRESDYKDNKDKYQKDKAAWNEAWNMYYPDIKSPQDQFDDGAVSTDTTYANYTDIELVAKVRPEIAYVTPGVYVGGSVNPYTGYEQCSVPFRAASGLILYEGAGNKYTFEAKVYHQDVDVTGIYHTECQHESGLMYYGLTTDKYMILSLPYYFGNAATQVLDNSGSTNDKFIKSTATVKLDAAKVTLGVNNKYVKKWHSYNTPPLDPNDPNGYYYWTWQETSINTNAWFGRLLLSTGATSPKNGTNAWFGRLLLSSTLNIHQATLNTGVTELEDPHYIVNASEGIKFSWPLEGCAAARLTYPKVLKQVGINNQDAFTLTKVPTASITGDNRIYVDRGDKAKSYNWFNVIYNSASPAESPTSGNYSITLESPDNIGLYYAKKKSDQEANEIYADYYLPGIVFGDPDSSLGNMSRTTSYPVMALRWVPKTVDIPTSGIMTFSKTNSTGTVHSFYKTPPIGIVRIDSDAYDFNTGIQPIEFVINGVTMRANYVAALNTTVPPVDDMVLCADTAMYDCTALTVMGVGPKIAYIPLKIDLFYNNNTCTFYRTDTVGYDITSATSTTVVIENAGKEITYLPASQQLVSPKADTLNVTPMAKTSQYNIKAIGAISATTIAYFKSIYDGVCTGDIVTFEYEGSAYSFDVGVAKSTNTGISVLSTDIREASKTKPIGFIQQEGQYQLLKQQWNTTVEVENYWWIDATHILELNAHALVLKRNTGELDDWNGNRFEKIQEVSRDSIIPTNVIRYFVTNVYNSNATALFCTLRVEKGSITIELIDPREKFSTIGTIDIMVACKNIGEKLNVTSFVGNTAYLNTYNPITVEQVLSKADWSSTIVNNRLIIGCHLSSNYDQWALVYDLTTHMLTNVIQGYGYVGLQGDLTGGMIPADYFNIAQGGFNDTVLPLTALGGTEDKDINNLDAAYEINDANMINSITPKVVGTGEQQWYIKKTLYGIVSHLTFNGTGFTPQILPITNNYSASYKSPSFSSYIFGDGMLQALAMSTMLKLDGSAEIAWNLLWTLCGMPTLYYIAPRMSALNYLQQTFGQYAYVHYNSSKRPTEREIGNSITDSGIGTDAKKQADPVLSSVFTFDKQKFTQEASSGIDIFNGGIMAMMCTAMSDTLQILDTKLSLNEEQAQSAISDTGRKYVDNVEANVGDMIASGIVSQSKNNMGITSTITGLKSLDMFYSTSDQQHVYAGPGFVEHQLVADCVAQSVTDVKVEGKVQTVFFCIRALTTLQAEMILKLTLHTADAMDKFAEATAQQMVKGTSLAAVAVGMHGVAAALRTAASAQQVALRELAVLLDAICAKGITSTVDGAVSERGLTVEGKHTYGEKNEVFMWPCWGIKPKELVYTDEWVESGIRNTPWRVNLGSRLYYRGKEFNFVNTIMQHNTPKYSSHKATIDKMTNNTGHGNYGGFSDADQDKDNEAGDCFRAYFHEGNMPYYQASAYGKAVERTLPDDMAKVEGVIRFLPNEPFKNENIAVSDPAFTPSMQQDYIIDKSWDLSQYCTYGAQQWIAVKDTKVIDCPPSNMYVNGVFCGIASPYTAVEVKRGIQQAYLRPWAVTPTTLALNCTGYNAIFDNKLYHAFDGISYRLVDLVGSPGMSKSRQSFWYAFQVNDRFKRSNKVPANELQGNFESEPVQSVASIDKLYTLMTVSSKEKGLEAGTIGEDKDLIRWAIPVFTEHVSTLPAAVKTMTGMTLGVVEGITSLCVDLANNQAAYKAPLSVDFTISKNMFRATEEYICSVQTQDGIDTVTDLIPTLGLKYIGATPTEAFFYSKATRFYYSFTGSALTKMEGMERFRDIQKGYWDFVNQEVVMPCLMTYKRLNAEVEDKDSETDNIIVPVMSKGEVSGELPPPITTIFNDRSWYKCVSLPSGFAYQGPNRVVINRSVFVEYMLESMKDNFGKWKRMSREKYTTKRGYSNKYNSIVERVQGVDGWTHNPFLLVTSPLGQSEDTDCLYEWNVTFCWPIEMDLLYGTDHFAVVNITAETMTPGGKVLSRPTHIFLTKELFTRNGNYGYYSFRFQSKNGAGNRERLHIWSDQYIAISSLNCEIKVVTSKRTEQLTQQVDVHSLKEL